VSRRTRLADSLIGTGFPFRRGDNFKRYLDMFADVMNACAGLRRPGSAALDLCYVAAGWYDAFFEPGLSPWDVAAGSLIVTEAGGLVGNFAGEGDFLHGRELLAGSPKIFGHLVHLLGPHVEKQRMALALAGAAEAAAPDGDGAAEVAAAFSAALGLGSGGDVAVAGAPMARQRQAVRIRKPGSLTTAAKTAPAVAEQTSADTTDSAAQPGSVASADSAVSDDEAPF
jgi:myo-inositol-1(or 4)-monophosphatase